jgi:hypothetical protein
MSSGLISELDHQLTDLAHLIMAPREITLPYVMAQLKCDQEEANGWIIGASSCPTACSFPKAGRCTDGLA